MAKRDRNESMNTPTPSDEFIEPTEAVETSALAKVEEPPKAAKPKKAPPAPTEAPKPKVAFRVFAQLHGAKQDQLAGFGSYVKRAKLESMTVADWHAAYDKFMKSPVGKPIG